MPSSKIPASFSHVGDAEPCCRLRCQCLMVQPAFARKGGTTTGQKEAIMLPRSCPASSSISEPPRSITSSSCSLGWPTVALFVCGVCPCAFAHCAKMLSCFLCASERMPLKCGQTRFLRNDILNYNMVIVCADIKIIYIYITVIVLYSG